MNEGGGDDDAGTEVTSKEINVEGNMDFGDSFGDDGEEGCAGRNGHDYEKGGNAGAELTVIFVGRGGNGADDITWVGS